LDPRSELLAEVEALNERQVDLMLGWARMLKRGPRVSRDEGDSIGPLGDVLGIVSELREGGRSRMRASADVGFHNPNGVLHGGVIYTMVDTGMGGAVTSLLKNDEYCLTIELKISYLAQVREGSVVADTDVIKLGRNVAFTESKVHDGDDRLVATASGSMFILRPEA
jgi:acyl-CoA thioesterase